MSSDFCIKCDHDLSVYCGRCVNEIYYTVDSRTAEVERLREHLRAVLACWKREADQGDGIDEAHVEAYQAARAALEEVKP